MKKSTKFFSTMQEYNLWVSEEDIPRERILDVNKHSDGTVVVVHWSFGLDNYPVRYVNYSSM